MLHYKMTILQFEKYLKEGIKNTRIDSSSLQIHWPQNNEHLNRAVSANKPDFSQKEDIRFNFKVICEAANA